jgi:hypothetical protein
MKKEENTSKIDSKWSLKGILKRFGVAGFLFFLIKGLIWLAIFAIGWIWGPEAIDAIKGFFSNVFS